MMARVQTVSAAFAVAISIVEAMQVSPMKSRKDLQLIMLDESEVQTRGSHCLDGSTPGYLYKKGTADDKWLFWFQGNAACTSEEACAAETVNIKLQAQDDLPLMKTGEFSEYHHVMFERCDVNLFMGDLAEPVEYNGQKLYFQGKRIIDHVVDTLQSNSTLGSAKEVLISGGSGGGQTAFIIADYFAGIMPKSVTKFGVVPINGWYASATNEELKYMYGLANMKSAVSPSCAAAYSEDEAYKCLDPAVSYTHSKSSTFLVQAFDYTFSFGEDISQDVKSAWTECLYAPASTCDDSSITVLQNHLDSFTTNLQSKPKYNEVGQGGFLFTCTEHQFYDDDDLFNQYANNGVGVGDAISSWWQSMGTAAATWYLPCDLGSSSNPQCESSCTA